MFKRKHLLEMRLYLCVGSWGRTRVGARLTCARALRVAVLCSQEDCSVCTLSAGPGMMQALMKAEVDCKL